MRAICTSLGAATGSGDYFFSCPSVPRRSLRRSSRAVRRSFRRTSRPVRRSWRRFDPGVPVWAVPGVLAVSGVLAVPGVWASASGAVSTATGIPMPNAAPSPRIQKALRREIVAASIFSRMANLPWVYATGSRGRRGHAQHWCGLGAVCDPSTATGSRLYDAPSCRRDDSIHWGRQIGRTYQLSSSTIP